MSASSASSTPGDTTPLEKAINAGDVELARRLVYEHCKLSIPPNAFENAKDNPNMIELLYVIEMIINMSNGSVVARYTNE